MRGGPAKIMLHWLIIPNATSKGMTTATIASPAISPEASGKYLADAIARWGKVVKENGITNQ